jgi:hypothetical protein
MASLATIPERRKEKVRVEMTEAITGTSTKAGDIVEVEAALADAWVKAGIARAYHGA